MRWLGCAPAPERTPPSRKARGAATERTPELAQPRRAALSGSPAEERHRSRSPQPGCWPGRPEPHQKTSCAMFVAAAQLLMDCERPRPETEFPHLQRRLIRVLSHRLGSPKSTSANQNHVSRCLRTPTKRCEKLQHNSAARRFGKTARKPRPLRYGPRAGPPDSGPRALPDSVHGCKSSSSPRLDGPRAPARS
jgi:hypothetical protein